MDEEINLTIPEPDEDIEDEGGLVQVGERDREEQEKINKKYAYLCRPPLDPNFDEKSVLEIMSVDVDYYLYRYPGETNEKAIIRIYGVNDNQNSVMIHVHNFKSYFFVESPPEFDPTLENLEDLKNKFNNRFGKGSIQDKNPVIKVEAVMKESIRYFKKNGDARTTFLKIYTRQPKYVPTLRGYFEKIVQIDKMEFEPVTYESNMPFALRFMIDIDLKGMSWLRIQPGKFKIRPFKDKNSNCQLEIDCKYDDIEALPSDGDYLKIAPLRILSFDIECCAEHGFPKAEKDPVIQIANVCKVHTESTNFVNNIFTLGTCSNIVGAEVRSHKSEVEMLQDWQEFLIAVDPDIITGFNIINFDIPYIIDRANALNIKNFGKFGRILNAISKVKSAVYQSKAMGMRETKDINIDGRIQLDMLMIMHVEHKLSSYSLNNVSYHFLKEQKEDVHHSIIRDLQNGNADTRRRIAVYCLKDALLPLKLMDKLMSLYNYTEMARVTGVPIRFLFVKGQQIKVASQLYRKAMKVDYLIPVERHSKSDGKYEGADVLDPKTGFYRDPIATLDFASLYPSIMMAHNLCYTTLVKKFVAEKTLKPDQYHETPHKDYFVKPEVRRGLLPLILEELLAARKKAKEDLKNEKDPFKAAVLDGRQLALKISANSVYGFTGAQIGQLPCLEIASSVTAYGRTMIFKTKECVEKKYCKANGYEHDAEVIYGDTDSVMVKFGVKTVAEAMELGRECSKYITNEFIKPIKLEFEKVYYPYLLLAKKRYAGLYWSKPEKYDKLDKKGIESVRRDNCLLVRNMVDTVLNKIIIDQDLPGAMEYVKMIISDLLQNKIDLSYLVISKSISKKIEGDEEGSNKDTTKKPSSSFQKKEDKPNKFAKDKSNTYKAKSAHVELAQKIQQREGGVGPAIGDRIAYVMITGARGSKNYENAEDPIYVLENDLPIDFNYYLEKQIKNPMMRIFEPIIPNPDSLFAGKHTQAIYVPKVNQNRGLGSFVQVKLQCLGCKVGINKGALCESCEAKNKRMDIHLKKLFDLRELQAGFSELWTQCQRCQGSLHQDVLCTNRDCPIFYKRKKVQKEIEASQTVLDRFDNSW